MYTGRISGPSLRFNDALPCLMLMASLTLCLMFESSDVKILVFSGLIVYPMCEQCSNIVELDLAIFSLSLISSVSQSFCSESWNYQLK